MAADPIVTRGDATPAASTERAPASTTSAGRLRLLLLSFLMLFVELALIRWTAANNVYLASLTNFVLLASFLGIGIGFLRADSRWSLLPLTPVVLALLVGFVLAFPVSINVLGVGHLLHGAQGLPLLTEWLSVSIVFLLVAATLAAIGQEVARSFQRFSPLEAYRLDILGSLLGITAFSALSFLWLPPIAWGAVASLVLIALIWRGLRWWQIASLVAVLALLGVESASSLDHWSPYYKIHAVHAAAPSFVRDIPTHGVTTVWANNIPHQTAYPISTLRRLEPFYFYPYRHIDRTRLNNVLIVGAGTGNDVAVALSEGAKHVDAVEIDPVIQSLGRRWHPDRPYQSPRVSVHINDGRAFIQNTGSRYDLILFALPDSLTLITGQTNLRLENYLFTVESMRRVKSILEPGGTFSMYNYYSQSLLDRYATTLCDGIRLPAMRGGRQPARRPPTGCPHHRRGSSAQLQQPLEPTQELRGDRRLAVPLSVEPCDPIVLPPRPGARADRLAGARVACGRRADANGSVSGSVLHGRRL